ncbi:MAG: hypothetical protein IT182_04645 [Acidobacteria bacterium]|nr:hypothetical protein [Acidobacteriota bacterium]
MGKQAASVDSQVLARIHRQGPGTVFTPADFADLGPRNAVDLALSRNARAGAIRKLARGVYDLPRRDKRLGDLSPSPDDIASALAGRDAARLQASGAHAANLLGLSDQVPVRLTFLTDGRSRRVQLGRQQIILKHTTPRQMATAGRISGTVIQALRWLGQDHVDDRVVAKLRRRLSGADKRQLQQDLRYAPTWVADVMRTIAAPSVQ